MEKSVVSLLVLNKFKKLVMSFVNKNSKNYKQYNA